MKLYDAAQLKARDIFTTKKLGITSFELMTKASKALSKEIVKLMPNQDMPIHIFCGNGNNGGDGMLIAKQLRNEFINVTVYECAVSADDSIDYGLAEQEAKSVSNINFVSLKKEKDFPSSLKGIIVDALLGSGINRALEGNVKDIVTKINQCALPILSIDLPSGMPVDGVLQGECIKATFTLTVEDYKASFFYEENNDFIGEVITVPIGLSKEYEANTSLHYLTASMIDGCFVPRRKFSHKGDYGHTLLVCGSKGMAGAAVLSTAAALRSGVGLVTVCVDECINDVLQVSQPEAMTINALKAIDLSKFASIGVGCGLGQSEDAKAKVDWLLSNATCPMIIDADALNIIASENWLDRMPKNSILTPHPKEFDRLFGNHKGHFDRCQAQVEHAKSYQIFIVLKSAHTSIATPDGQLYFNTTGNAGMAKGGSGDVLTGYMAGLVAMLGYHAKAVMAAVYLHGQAGDKAMAKWGERSMKSGDIVDQLGQNISTKYL
jgi:ADP-dependent NAD(P)H-hydrate dehydratase / NAD(P)H-hydrate epimerase